MYRVIFLVLIVLLGACGQSAVDVPAAPLHALAEHGETERLLGAIMQSGEVDRRDVCYRTPLMLAAQHGHVETVRRLLAAGARVDLHEKGYYTALMLAAGNGHTDVVRVLSAAGASVDEVEITRGWTALLWAAKRGHLDTVELLLGLGADRGVRDRQGRSAYDWAVIGQHSDVAALLHRSG